MREMHGQLCVRPYQPLDEASVIDLWKECGLINPQNDPRRDIEMKLKVQPELFLVGSVAEKIVAAVMAGYDGHRGWINYLAVSPEMRGSGLGRRMVSEAESRLKALGCQKVNLLVRESNRGVLGFYERLGFHVEGVVAMGKRI
jgi:ribosomal protein S18 acetylase RimI-like enzyme